MNSLENFHFIRPIWLLLIPVVVWMWWTIRKSHDPFRSLRSVIQPEFLDAMIVGRDGSNRRGEVGLLIAWTLAVIAVAGPTWRPEASPFADDPIPVMLLLKAGESMELSDLTPSRMERARLKVVDFANERKGEPLGLIVYAGTSHLVLPPTRDTYVVATMAAEIEPSIMPKPGDELTAALALATKTLNGKTQAARTAGDAGGSIIVVADTVPADSQQQLAKFRAEYNSRIHFLGIARPGTPEEAALRAAASALNASLTLLTPDAKDIQELARRTAKAPVSVAAAGEGVRWSEAGWWLVPILAVLVLLAFRREESTQAEVQTS